ncbi:hypothetical protein PLICRDRAFT_143741 [Plicaturopsis crispa FD-325 SS-3]|nr:hypothetical protein PLICRDRAFT_143741 [Plicaturopsis crispa FD-325 SS-3]
MDPHLGREFLAREDADMRDGTGELVGDDDPDSESDNDRDATPLKMQAKKKKPVKGETRSALDAMKDTALKELSMKTPASKGKASTVPKPKATAARSSGLVRDWRNRVHAVGSEASSSKTKPAKPASDDDTLGLGGLDDDDASAVRPQFSTQAGRSRDRNNEMVGFVSDGEESESYQPKTPKTQGAIATAGRVASSKSKPSTSKAKAPSDVHTSGTTSRTVPSHVPSDSSSSSLVTQRSLSRLPQWAQADWNAIFLPMLYSYLGSLDNPWLLLNEGDRDCIPELQAMVNTCYPEIAYRVRFNDGIYLTAKDRVNDKRCWFGRRAIAILEKLFKTAEYNGKPSKIAAYAQYATRGDGPAIYGIPAPFHCADRKSREYTLPRDLFESPYILELLAGYLNFMKASEIDYDVPRGALALAATAIERAFTMYHTGKQVPLGQFSRDKTQDLVNDYMVSIQKLSDRRWSSILEKCGQAVGPPKTIAPALQHTRRNLYVPPSSPIAEDENSDQ